VNDALKVCAGFMEQLGRKYRIPVVDYWTIMSEVNKRIQRDDSTATVVSADRVHPAGPGNLVMAYEFLKSARLPSLVSKLVIDKSASKSLKKSENCKISDFQRSSDSIVFNYLSGSLPYPVRDDQQKALTWIPFTEHLNQELIIVKHLKPGRYKLIIGEENVGEFTHAALRKGINLAGHDTPQKKHAQNVRTKLVEFWKLQADQRTLKHVEYMHLKDFARKDDMAAVKIYLDSLHRSKYPENTYLKTRFDNYVIIKPKESELSQELYRAQDQVYLFNKPKTYQMKLVRQ
jgi:endoglucanase